MAGRSKVISVSLDEDLLGRFDGWVAAKGFQSRSNGFQALVRAKLDELTVGDDRGPAVATVTFVYDHHQRELLERLAHLQHENLGEVVASMHVHLDHSRCLEVLILRGPARAVRTLGERIVATRGVERGEVVVTSARSLVEREHDHDHGADHEHPHRKRRRR